MELDDAPSQHQLPAAGGVVLLVDDDNLSIEERRLAAMYSEEELDMMPPPGFELGPGGSHGQGGADVDLEWASLVAVSLGVDVPVLGSAAAPVNSLPGTAIMEEAYAHGGFGALPASGYSVATLETRKHDAGDGGCVICIEEYEVGEELSVVPCEYRHAFHRSCLEQWLAQSRLCPLCRHALPAKGDERWA
ncbi:probable E3 ubiquitin-protein ligase ATL45 [Brachypodium distachyon]|uniref:RING-type domain-containing protein n=1 Tax=Brachypodium distachyon TaxID=15368 RepID=I1IUE2_BRADI|nr:probable E3 ubiquitin-protein ligase ATL45 [Brachypodium distachyon]KQJ92286.1 hypothetical protein BRADI_4g42660v3 [Brachypodium distachyon]|eukprot:XP_010239516.1 probable E3 ubiquitin-protein ligase ATL45 [Brachypodium distachyon]